MSKQPTSTQASSPPPQTQPQADESLRPALEALAERDPDIARALADCGLPPIRQQDPGFKTLLRNIIAQQVSTALASAIIGRLLAAAKPLTPKTFLALDDGTLREIGFSRQKVAYGRSLAEGVQSGTIDLGGLAAMADEEAIEHLIQAKGIGRWTAEVYLLFAMGRPDIWPVGDLAVCVAAQRLKGLADRPSPTEMQDLGAPWRPYRSAAARFLWHFYRHQGVPDIVPDIED